MSIRGNPDLKLLTTVCNLSASGKQTLFIVYCYPVINNSKIYLVEYLYINIFRVFSLI